MIEGPGGARVIEPLVMKLFLELVDHVGMLVTRQQLFSSLWGAAPVGDDNLNRLVAALRRTLAQLGVGSVLVDTVAGLGYVLRLAPSSADAVLEEQEQQAQLAGYDSWRLGLPEPDYLRIALLSKAAEAGGAQARTFGLLALLHRHAAEYGPSERVSDHVHSCQAAARRAVALDPDQPEARTALVGVAPLYGRWEDASRHLTALCDATGGHPVPENDLSVLEMATGQVRAATRRRNRLIRLDPFAAIYSYKSVYQHWSLGAEVEMDHAADRGMQLWPFHPAIWTARLWTLAYTNRVPAAQALLAGPPPQGIPAPMLVFLAQVLAAARDGDESSARRVASSALEFAGRGPPQAIAALFALGLIGRVHEGFTVANSYYLHQGQQPVPLQPGSDHPRLNEQNRRVTQILFTPACAAMRRDPRFADLCRGIGLTSFWDASGITPDHLL
jgi:hypothetical protein